MKQHRIRRLVAVALAVACAGALAQAPEGRLYAPGAFDQLEVEGAGQVRLSQGDRDEVFVAGDASTQAGAAVRRVGNRMKISLPGGWKFWNSGKAQVDVRMRNVRRITLSGAGDLIAAGPIASPQLSIDIAGSGLVRLDDLNVGQLDFDISGAGEGQLAGKAAQLRLSVSGKGKITADQLRVGSARVSISGVGNAELWVDDTLDVDISGAGHIRYWGQPKVRPAISGLGSVDPRGEKR